MLGEAPPSSASLPLLLQPIFNPYPAQPGQATLIVRRQLFQLRERRLTDPDLDYLQFQGSRVFTRPLAFSCFHRKPPQV